MQDHRKLKAFQLADDWVLAIYKATASFPDHERFGLVSQLRRAAVSVPGNIVEACGRDGLKDYVRFLQIAFSSLRETGYYVGLSQRLGYLPDPQAEVLLSQYDECAKVLAALIASLRKKM